MTETARRSLTERPARVTRRQALGLLGGAGAAALLAACGGPPTPTPGQGQTQGGGRRGGTLRIAEVADPRTFNPLR